MPLVLLTIYTSAKISDKTGFKYLLTTLAKCVCTTH